MKLPAGGILSALAVAAFTISIASAQTFASTPSPAASEAAQLQELTKKIEEQNAKIDMLSQQILKLQQQLGERRPGVMIGEGASSSPTGSTVAASTTSTTSTSAVSASPSTFAGNGNNHVVARGETLTSIAHQHNVSVSDLQKFNHIENPLKLQAGQTLQIPPSPVPSPSSSGE